MTMESALIIGTLGGICGMFGLFCGLVCVAMVAGFTRSTHTVQYMPFDNHNDTEVEKTEEELAAENEAALLNKVGRKKRVEEPTVVNPLDEPIEQINQSDIRM